LQGDLLSSTGIQEPEARIQEKKSYLTRSSRFDRLRALSEVERQVSGITWGAVSGRRGVESDTGTRLGEGAHGRRVWRLSSRAAWWAKRSQKAETVAVALLPEIATSLSAPSMLLAMTSTFFWILSLDIARDPEPVEGDLGFWIGFGIWNVKSGILYPVARNEVIRICPN